MQSNFNGYLIAAIFFRRKHRIGCLFYLAVNCLQQSSLTVACSDGRFESVDCPSVRPFLRPFICPFVRLNRSHLSSLLDIAKFQQMIVKQRLLNVCATRPRISIHKQQDLCPGSLHFWLSLSFTCTFIGSSTNVLTIRDSTFYSSSYIRSQYCFVFCFTCKCCCEPVRH